jgi:hypothetical protein
LYKLMWNERPDLVIYLTKLSLQITQEYNLLEEDSSQEQIETS